MKTGLQPRAHEFKTNIRWIQFRKGVLSSNDKNPIEIACPAEFGGHHGYWTAEHLFVAAIETCIMTTFKWLLEKTGGRIVAYESEAVGGVEMIDGDFRFVEVEINPVITVSEARDSPKARNAIENAHKRCLISKVLDFEVKVNPIIRTR